jgi:hypothetical protein
MRVTQSKDRSEILALQELMSNSQTAAQELVKS